MAIDVERIEKNILNSYFSDILGGTPEDVTKLFKDEHFMYSIYRFFNSERAKKNLKTRGVHDYAKTEGTLMLDSGGFQYLSKSRQRDELKQVLDDVASGTKTLPVLEIEKKRAKLLKLTTDARVLTAEELVEIYTNAGLQSKDRCISLDLPPLDLTPPQQSYEMVLKNNEMFLYLRDNLPPSISKRLVPVIHGWDERTINKSFEVAEGCDLVSIGGFFPVMATGRWRNLIAKFKIILKLVHDHDGIRFHGLGANGQCPSHLCWYSGIEQTDSASWRHNARNVKLIFAGIQPGSISIEHNAKLHLGQTVNWPAPWKDEHERALKECECPVCQGRNLEERKTVLRLEPDPGFKLRCIHNMYHFVKEREIAQELAGSKKYLTYLRRRFKDSIKETAFLRAIIEANSQTNLDQFFKFK